ncbi:MAG: hypothetical protein DWQ35_01660 [Planctomycetota bacterium]|nr:MAG: hypothetical protein DWQ35_01660 [Planctomycetota bacterium]REK23018.1 MAG: hypothetical protein DWQ42_15960 [Planctomycetota bacterium]REK43381.1 MAG: hypothetical protein DWQ46_11660 [Planctomycetota bacterium]
MTRLSHDTHDEAACVQRQVLREMTAEQRGELALQWSETMRATMLDGIRARHPDYDERRVVVEYARLTLEPELFEAAFGEEAAGYA